MKITILGTGSVGKALGANWASKGHTILFGSRDPGSEKVRFLLAEIPAASAAGLAEAAGQAEIIILATPWAAVESVLAAVPNWDGKILVDATNPIAPGLQLAVGGTTSGAELIARWAPGAHVVKAYNTTGNNNMLDPVYGGVPTTMLICGDDPAAKAVVCRLTEDLGFECVDAGPLAVARFLEPMALLWITLARQYGREIAFRMVKRQS